MNYKNKFFLLIILGFCQSNNVWALPEKGGLISFTSLNPRGDLIINRDALAREASVERKIGCFKIRSERAARKYYVRMKIEKCSLKGIYIRLTGLTVGLLACYFNNHK